MKTPTQTTDTPTEWSGTRRKFSVCSSLVFSILLTGMAIVAAPMTASAQSASSLAVKPTWTHCSPNIGAIGPFFVIPPGVSKSGMNCSQIFFTEAAATNWACYRNGRGNGLWPQMTSPFPNRGLSAANFSC